MPKQEQSRDAVIAALVVAFGHMYEGYNTEDPQLVRDGEEQETDEVHEVQFTDKTGKSYFFYYEEADERAFVFTERQNFYNVHAYDDELLKKALWDSNTTFQSEGEGILGNLAVFLYNLREGNVNA